ncbi:MAG: hypothetical protein GY937_07095 [bacterium]|nr:hypothetical protein [bacterium]
MALNDLRPAMVLTLVIFASALRDLIFLGLSLMFLVLPWGALAIARLDLQWLGRFNRALWAVAYVCLIVLAILLVRADAPYDPNDVFGLMAVLEMPLLLLVALAVPFSIVPLLARAAARPSDAARQLSQARQELRSLDARIATAQEEARFFEDASEVGRDHLQMLERVLARHKFRDHGIGFATGVCSSALVAAAAEVFLRQ